MKKHPLNKPPSPTVLSLQVRPRAADSLAARIREMWMVEPVQLARPGEAEVWLEIYFPTVVEAQLASRSLASAKEVLASSVRGYAPRDWRSFWKHHFKARDIGARQENPESLCREDDAACPEVRGRLRRRPGGIPALLKPRDQPRSSRKSSRRTIRPWLAISASVYSSR